MKTLFYTRPWSIEFFKYVGSNLFGGLNCVFISDHKGMGEETFYNKFNEVFRKKNKNFPESKLDEETRNDIIFRDRLLRKIPYKKALRMLFAMEVAIEYFLEMHEIKMIMSIAIDCYVNDLLDRISLKRNIPFFGFATPFVNGYMLVTRRGELNSFVSPKPDEIEKVFSMLNRKSYKSEYMNKYPVSFLFMVKQWFRELLKAPYFLLKLLLIDRLNYHYLSTFQIAISRLKLNQLNIIFLYDKDWAIKLNEWKGIKVYLPLQLYPEMNAEYWCQHTEFMPYPDGVLKLVEIFSQFSLVLIKEHPSMMGLRDINFYKKLKAMQNVLIVPTVISQKKLIDSSDAVLTMNSSVGIEAVLQDKPVFTMGNSYYSFSRMHYIINTFQELKNVYDIVINHINQPTITEMEKKEYIQKILTSFLPCDPNELFFKVSDKERKAKVDNLISVMREYLPLWLKWSQSQSAS